MFGTLCAQSPDDLVSFICAVQVLGPGDVLLILSLCVILNTLKHIFLSLPIKTATPLHKIPKQRIEWAPECDPTT